MRVVKDLHDVGFTRVVMMTGDSRKTAAAVANRLGMDEFYAEVLPEDKAAFIRREHDAGRKVVMIGDGINDSPALSEADAGVAIAAGAAIAREIADITISADNLQELIVLRQLSNRLMDRIDNNYRRIMLFNGGLIALGLFGVMPPATSALCDAAGNFGAVPQYFDYLFQFGQYEKSSLILRRPLGYFAMQTTPEVLLFSARTIFSFYYPHLTSIVSVAMISSTVTSNIAARITILSIVGIAVPWIHL